MGGAHDHRMVSDRGRNLLRIAGLDAKVEVSVESSDLNASLQTDNEGSRRTAITQELRSKNRKKRRRDLHRVPSISIRTDYSGDLLVFEVIYNSYGVSQGIDFSSSLADLYVSGAKKVVVDFHNAPDIGTAVAKVIEFLRATYDYLVASRGRLVLSSLSPSITHAVIRDPALFSLNRYKTQKFARDALREPPNEKSLGSGAST